MPLQNDDGSWSWGNLTRPTKGQLTKVVYGIWISQGKPGTWHNFWHSGKPYGPHGKTKSKKQIKESYSFL